MAPSRTDMAEANIVEEREDQARVASVGPDLAIKTKEHMEIIHEYRKVPQPRFENHLGRQRKEL